MNEWTTDSDSSQSTTKHSGTNLFDKDIPYNPQDYYISSTVTFPSVRDDSKWTCYLSGRPGDSFCTVFTPRKGQEPNWFHRKMQELIFGLKWVKKK